MPEEHIQPAEKVRTLIVDDSRVIRRAINVILKDDADIIEAVDGEDGWNKLLQNKDIQVMITDIEMPVLDGYQLICRIRAHDDEHIKDIPVITITGAEDEETRTRAFACGATDFITKPIDKVQLKARVRAHGKLEEKSRQLEETTATLEEEASTDPVTGLTSRRYFGLRGEQDVAHALRHKSELSLLRIEIDSFKKIYNECGDALIDEVIKWIASTLSKTARTEDTVARVGGSEFAILAPASGGENASILGERLRQAVSEKPFVSGQKKIGMTISIGIATLVDYENETFLNLLSKASKHLTFAKAEGGDCVSSSTRTEAMIDQEEVVLSEAPPEVAPEVNAQEIISEAARAFSEKSIEELEKEIAFEVESQGGVDSWDGIGVDNALALLNDGDSEKVKPHILKLSTSILPLLEFCDKTLKLELSRHIDTIRAKLKSNIS